MQAGAGRLVNDQIHLGVGNAPSQAGLQLGTAGQMMHQHTGAQAIEPRSPPVQLRSTDMISAWVSRRPRIHPRCPSQPSKRASGRRKSDRADGHMGDSAATAGSLYVSSGSAGI